MDLNANISGRVRSPENVYMRFKPSENTVSRGIVGQPQVYVSGTKPFNNTQAHLQLFLPVGKNEIIIGGEWGGVKAADKQCFGGVFGTCYQTVGALNYVGPQSAL
jgi:hypothetical protein